MESNQTLGAVSKYVSHNLTLWVSLCNLVDVWGSTLRVCVLVHGGRLGCYPLFRCCANILASMWSILLVQEWRFWMINDFNWLTRGVLCEPVWIKWMDMQRIDCLCSTSSPRSLPKSMPKWYTCVFLLRGYPLQIFILHHSLLELEEDFDECRAQVQALPNDIPVSEPIWGGIPCKFLFGNFQF